MNKIRKIFNSIVICFIMVGCFSIGIFLHSQNTDNQVSAELSQYNEIVNYLPEFISISHEDGVQMSEDKSTFFTQGESTINVSIATAIKTLDGSGSNYAYFTSEENKNDYYYFEFYNSLALYYNVTNTELDPSHVSNLLKTEDRGKFASQNSNAFSIPGEDVDVPEKFEMKIKLDNVNDSGTVTGSQDTGYAVSVHDEGIYTLSIKGRFIHTTNNGQTYSTGTVDINYTFMIFDYDTYFLQDNVPDTNMNSVNTATLTNNLSYSKYFYYNYSSKAAAEVEGTAGGTGNLPTLQYNPHKYRIHINYTDTFNNADSLHTAIIEASFTQGDGEVITLTQKDANGNDIAPSNQFVQTYVTSSTQDKTVQITFNDIGQYDITFEFIYTGLSTYTLPYQVSAQRLYIFGYQALYTDYAEVDEQTNITVSKELKTPNNTTFINAADITTKLDYTGNDFHSNSEFLPQNLTATNFTTSSPALYTKAVNAANNLTPVSTNQPPIKFNSMSKLYSGYIFTKGNDGFTYKSPFTGLNVNDPGTYLILIDYKFNNYKADNGVDQPDLHHFQVFYFTIVNTNPTIQVFDENANVISTKGYTNKNVYIIDNSASSPYDADVRITLSARDYTRSSEVYFFEEYELSDPRLNSYGTYHENEQINNAAIQSKIGSEAQRYFILNNSLNAEFIINIYSGNAKIASSRSFKIDTSEIGDIYAFGVQFASNSSYVIGSQSNTITNQSLVFSWREKLSGASTYGVFKYFPIQDIQYYPNSNYSSTIKTLLDANILPVNALLDLTNLSQSWTDYYNSWGYTNSANSTNSIPSSYVKSSPGIYLFEVYDDAGNYNFEIYLIDNTTPLFVKMIEATTGSFTNTIAQMNETITISDSYTASIVWAQNKGIYIKNYTGLTALNSQLQPKEVSQIPLTGYQDALKTKITNFFNDNSSYIGGVSGNLFGDSNLSYNNQYIKVGVDETFYFRHASKNTYDEDSGYQKQLQFTERDASGKDVPIEGTYSFLVRDAANSFKSDNPRNDFTNYPSGYLSVTVSSDISELKIYYTDNEKDTELEREGYSLSGQFYEVTGDNATDDEGNSYTKGQLIKNKIDQSQLKEDLGYKYAYYRPYISNNRLSVSFKTKPSKDGVNSIVQSVQLKYYPYIKQYKNIETYYKNQKFTSTAWYYTLDENTEKDNFIYKYSEGVEPDETFVYSLSFDGTGEVKPGRYEIIRTYQQPSSSNDISIDKYDYFERTLIVNVDPYNVITVQESVDGKTDEGDNNGKTSLESVIGGDIFISMYNLASQSNIHISFPTYDPSLGLNVGSLYKGEVSENGNITNIAVMTNKMPVAVFIPEYKYTTYYQYNYSNNKYSVEENNSLSRFGDAYIAPYNIRGERIIEATANGRTVYYEMNESGEIKTDDFGNNVQATLYEYRLYVHGILVNTFESNNDDANAKRLAEAALAETEIYEYKLNSTITYSNGNTRKYYKTNGTSTDGYLNFYEVASSSSEVAAGSQPVTEFKEPGSYDVIIYQAGNRSSNSYNFYRFVFNIESVEPDFELLNSDEVALKSYNNNYYTNSKELIIRWEDDNRDTFAKIDQKEISIVINNAPQTYNIVDSGINNLTHTITLSLNSYWQNGTRIVITMQFEGHNDDYYNKTTKVVIVDYSAPVDNLVSLMNKVTNSLPLFTRLYQELNTRELKDANNNDINTTGWTTSAIADSQISEVSYSYTKPTGILGNYTYNVSSKFIEDLRQNISALNPTQTQFIYVKDLGQDDALPGYIHADKDTPLSDYLSLHSLTIDEIQEIFIYNSYFEIVEQDLAGNMTVYIIHIYDLANDELEEDNYAIEFTNENNLDGHVTNQEIKSGGANIYSNLGFRFTKLNYLNDAWGIYEINFNDGSRKVYMKSPKLDGQVYLIDGVDTITFQTVTISSLFANVNSSIVKHSIRISDRWLGTADTLLVSIMRTALITSKYSNNTTAVLNINVPTAGQAQSTTTASLFPVEITILQGNNSDWAQMQTFTNYSGNPAEWVSNDPRFTFSYSIGQLTITINLGTLRSQKFKYLIKDNFGNITTVIQIANEETCEEVISRTSTPIYQLIENDSTTFLSRNSMTYQYNQLLYYIEVFKLDGGVETEFNNYFEQPASATIMQIDFPTITTVNYDITYRIKIYDDESHNDEDASPIRIIQLRSYYKLPIFNSDIEGNNSIYFKDKNHENIKEVSNSNVIDELHKDGVLYSTKAIVLTTYSSNVTVYFSNGRLGSSQNITGYLRQYNYSVYITSDNGINYEDITSYYASGYPISGSGNYKILVTYDSVTDDYGNVIFGNLCLIFDLTILDSSSVFYAVSVDGTIISPSDLRYTLNGREYTDVYLLSISPYDKNRVTIEFNNSDDEDMKTTLEEGYPKGTPISENVYIEEYSYKSRSYSDRFLIIYMGTITNVINPDDGLSYDDAFETPNSNYIKPLEQTSPLIVVASQSEPYSRLKISWNAYSEIPINLVNIEVTKLFNKIYTPITLNVYTEGNRCYTYLTNSGTYLIRFYDSCNPRNVQRFGSGDSLTVIFLKSVPFTVTYTDPATQEMVTTEPIAKAVYNGEVTLSLDLDRYFLPLRYPKISITKDGNPYEITSNDYSYTFTEPGYYVVSYSDAVTIPKASNSDGINLLDGSYAFTILNPNESRYSFDFSPYSSYYIESVIKGSPGNAQDITNDLIELAGKNVVIVNGEKKLSRLLVTYFDERTGAGRYTVTINTGDSTYKSPNPSLYGDVTAQRFTFSFWINMAYPPVSVSVAEGETTSNTIYLRFDAYRLHETVGDCYISIGNRIYQVNGDAGVLDELGGENASLAITERGTYYIQIYTTSGSLLFSYRVTKTDPLNTWAIIAIILGVLAFVTIVFITIKLRKRLKVK